MNPIILPIIALGGLGFFLLRREGAGPEPGGVVRSHAGRESPVLRALRRQPVSGFRRGMVVGDSHSEADWTFGGRMGEFLRAQGLEARVVGNRGWSVARYLSSGTLERELQSFRPDFLIVALGANDQVRPSGADDYQDRVRRVGELAKGWGVKRLVWFGPSKSEGSQAHRMEGRRFVAGLQKAALEHPALHAMDVRWFDSIPLTADLPTRDGVHMRRPEYLEWSRRAQALLT